MAKTIDELIDLSCLEIYRVLEKNGIPKTPIVVKLSEISNQGEPMTRLKRLEEFLIYLNEHQDKINAAEFRKLTINLMEKYPN